MKYLTAVRKYLPKFVTGNEEGAALAEYGLLLALIAVVCIAAITVLGLFSLLLVCHVFKGP
jgi:Flp pilus assembly pilin Flp